MKSITFADLESIKGILENKRTQDLAKIRDGWIPEKWSEYKTELDRLIELLDTFLEAKSCP